MGGGGPPSVGDGEIRINGKPTTLACRSNNLVANNLQLHLWEPMAVQSVKKFQRTDYRLVWG
jgi:hypothetical protein